VLNFETSFCFLADSVGYPFIGKYFPPSKMGVKSLYPVTVFLFTFIILVLIESYSIGNQSALHNEKIREMESEAQELGNKSLLVASGQKTDAIVEEQLKPRDHKGVLRRMINHPIISHYVYFFRMEK